MIGNAECIMPMHVLVYKFHLFGDFTLDFDTEYYNNRSGPVFMNQNSDVLNVLK